MNQKTLIGLAAAALLAIVVAIVINHTNAPRSEGDNGSEEKTAYLVPSLRDHVNDVDKLVLTGAENKPIATLTRNAAGWSIAEKGGYAVDTGKLRELLLKLADAKLLEQKTANKDKYATLGVEDLADKDAKGVEIELGGLGQPVKLIIGNANARSGTFVRRAGEAQSWLASGALNIDKKPESWLRKDLVDIAATRIASIAIARPDGKTIRIAKQAETDANFKLADVPKGREAGSDFAVNGVAATLAGFKLDDVVPAKDAPPGDKPLKARYATFDGLVVDVTAWEKDGKDYAQLAASVDHDQAGRHADAQTAERNESDTAHDAAAKEAKVSGAPEAGDAKSAASAATKTSAPADSAQDRQQKIVALDSEAADLNKRFQGWTYVLPAYKYASINKSPDELLKPLDDKNPVGDKKLLDEKKGDAAKKKAPTSAKSG